MRFVKWISNIGRSENGTVPKEWFFYNANLNMSIATIQDPDHLSNKLKNAANNETQLVINKTPIVWMDLKNMVEKFEKAKAGVTIKELDSADRMNKDLAHKLENETVSDCLKQLPDTKPMQSY